MKRSDNILVVILMMLLLTLFGAGDLSAQSGRRAARKVEKQMSGSRRKVGKESRVREPRAVTKAKRKQEKNESQRDKEYKRSLKDNKNRHFSIQTDEVKERMKQNQMELKQREKEKRKRARKDARKPGNAKKKYKK